MDTLPLVSSARRLGARRKMALATVAYRLVPAESRNYAAEARVWVVPL